jgi:hypothetical protein
MVVKVDAISQAAYHHLASVLTKANRTVQSVVKLGVTIARTRICADRTICGALGQSQYIARINK